MPHGMSMKEYDVLCQRVADKLGVDHDKARQAFSEMVQEDVKRIAKGGTKQ